MKISLRYKTPVTDETKEAVAAALEKIGVSITETSSAGEDEYFWYTAPGTDNNAACALFKEWLAKDLYIIGYHVLASEF
jgi:hypothetical protein